MKNFGPILAGILASSVAGCHSNEPEGSLVLEEQCTVDSSSFLELKLVDTEMETVKRAVWETVSPSTGFVVFQAVGEGEEVISSTPETEPGTSHEALILGLPQKTDFSWQVQATSEDGSTVFCSQEQSGTTGKFPFEPPELTFEAVDPALVSTGFVITTIYDITMNISYVVIFNEKGQYVWATETQGWAWQASLAIDGNGIVFNHPNTGEANAHADTITHMSFDAEKRSDTFVEGARTNFVELPDGSLATLTNESRELDGNLFVDTNVIEVNKDGSEKRSVWNAFDSLPQEIFSEECPDLGGRMYDCPHINGLSYNSTTNFYDMSAGELDAGLRVSREDGSTQWILGGKLSHFTMNDLSLLADPHSVRAVSEDQEVAYSRNLEGTCAYVSLITLNLEQMTAWEEWNVQICPPNLFVGDAKWIGDGKVLISAGSNHEIYMVSTETTKSEDGLIWQIHSAQQGVVAGFIDYATSLY